ncbi:MAG TPA: recombinase family protein, partial [Thermoanaerobacterales bacterium]|nr:recombinase family protein [Thermoanaerobacterales bacterium]
TPAKKKNWSAGTVRSILTNEKYKGDALLQKSYTVDFLTKKKKVNEGEIPQYYVENNHEAIIDSAVFDMVQRELESRQAGKNRHSGTHIFAGKIKCGECGSRYGSKVWHSNSKYRRVIWQCNHKFSGDKKCKSPHLDEETIKDIFLKATNKLLEDKGEIIANFEILESTAFNTDELENKKTELQNELEIAAEMIQNIINENAHTALDQGEYQRRYDSLVERFDTTKSNLELTTEQIKDKITRHKNLQIFLNELKNQGELITEFDPLLWNSLVNYVTVYEKYKIQVTFKNSFII